MSVQQWTATLTALTQNQLLAAAGLVIPPPSTTLGLHGSD